MKESGGLLDKKITFREKVKLIIHKWPLHLMMLPFVLYFIIFEIFPMVGVWIAFTDYNPYQGVFGSPFVGFDNFERFFKVYNFWQLILNTLSLSVVGLIAGLISSFVFALLLNEIQSVKYKRVVQICSYLPNFISVVVIAGMCFTFLNPDRGIINRIIVIFGGEAADFMSQANSFLTIYTLSGIWQHVGWSSILYIAVLSSIDPQLHEAATIDGASRMQRIWFINISALMPMVVLRLIMSVGGILNVGFEKAYLLQTPLNLDKSQIISTYMYEVSLGSIIQDYSYGTAVGLFNNVINVILMISANWLAKKANQETIW